MSHLPSAAADALNLVRELKILDDANIRVMEQMFSNRVNEDLVATMVIGKEGTIASTLFKLITSAHSPSVVGYLLRFTADVCQISPTLGKAFAVGDFGAVDPASKFMEIANTHAKVDGIFHPGMFLSAIVVRYTPESKMPAPRDAAASRFLAMMKQALSTNTLKLADIEYHVASLAQFVRNRDMRIRVSEAGLIKHLVRVLVECLNTDLVSVTQLCYDTLLTLWIVSYHYGCLAELYKSQAIPTVHKILQKAQKEKVIRMCLQIFKNFTSAQKKYYTANASSEWVDASIYLIGSATARGDAASNKGPNFYADLIGIGISKTLWQLARKKFGDADIAEYVEELTTILDQNMDAVTSFSEYRGEVLSGVLEWSPVHSSAKFWKENVSQFEENNFEVAEKLAELIQETQSDLTLAVCCHDIGELVRYHSSGRSILTLPQLAGVKERLMGLMSHDNPEVSKHALLAVQKILVQRWEFMQ